SPPKSACPGVSMMLIVLPPYRTAVFLARIVMPFSRSRSIESSTRSATSWFARNAPDCQSIASTSVVLPWSTWAIIATLRRSARTVTTGSYDPWTTSYLLSYSQSHECDYVPYRRRGRPRAGRADRGRHHHLRSHPQRPHRDRAAAPRPAVAHRGRAVGRRPGRPGRGAPGAGGHGAAACVVRCSGSAPRATPVGTSRTGSGTPWWCSP